MSRSIGTPIPGKFRAGDRAITTRQLCTIPAGQSCVIEQSIRMGSGFKAYYLCLIRSGNQTAWARESDLRAIGRSKA